MKLIEPGNHIVRVAPASLGLSDAAFAAMAPVRGLAGPFSAP